MDLKQLDASSDTPQVLKATQIDTRPPPLSESSTDMSSLHALKTGLLVLGWSLAYYATSAWSGIWNKELVGGAGAVSPTVLTLLHLLVSLGSDVAVMRYSKEGVPSFPPTHGRHTSWDILRSFVPVAIFMTLSKLTTYMSYQHVSVSLSHTAKASEPIWNVIVAAVVFREFYSQPVYLALAPIAIGVTLASVTDFTYNHTGFFWAVVSAIMKVLQNIYTKRLMSGGKFTFWEIHLYCGAASLMILTPALIVQSSTLTLASITSFPFVGIVGCSVLQYASSITSYAVLHLVSHLTFTIVNVLKRLFIIVAGMLYTHQTLRPLNTLGVVLAIGGILAYNIVKDVGSQAPSVDLLHPSTWAGWFALLQSRYNHIWREGLDMKHKAGLLPSVIGDRPHSGATVTIGEHIGAGSASGAHGMLRSASSASLVHSTASGALAVPLNRDGSTVIDVHPPASFVHLEAPSTGPMSAHSNESSSGAAAGALAETRQRGSALNLSPNQSLPHAFAVARSARQGERHEDAPETLMTALNSGAGTHGWRRPVDNVSSADDADLIGELQNRGVVT